MLNYQRVTWCKIFNATRLKPSIPKWDSLRRFGASVQNPQPHELINIPLRAILIDCGACEATDSGPLVKLMWPSVSGSALQTYKRIIPIFGRGTATKARSWRRKTATLTLSAFLSSSSHIKMEYLDHAKTVIIHWLWGVLAFTPDTYFAEEIGFTRTLAYVGGTMILADKQMIQ